VETINFVQKRNKDTKEREKGKEDERKEGRKEGSKKGRKFPWALSFCLLFHFFYDAAAS
jgi:flagellar biosynthesis/type III secretory pathway protein FliH